MATDNRTRLRQELLDNDSRTVRDTRLAINAFDPFSPSRPGLDNLIEILQSIRESRDGKDVDIFNRNLQR